MSSSNFVDYVKVCCRSGKGGGGSKHFHRDRTTAKGGPDGGDGGRGGHIIIKGNKQIWTLLSLKYRKHIIAAHGEAGGANLCFGKSGKDEIIEVPLGTVARDAETGEFLFEITHDGEEKVLLLLKNQYGLNDNDTLGKYHQSFWEEYIFNAGQQFGYKVPKIILKKLTKRWAFFDKSYKIPQMKKDLKKQPKFLEWVLNTDKQDHKNMVKKNMLPFEKIFFAVGADILENLSNFIAANPTKAVEKIRKEVLKASKAVRKAKDVKKMITLKQQLEKLNSIGGLKKIVPVEGIVFKYKGNTYKFTGAFAPVNQILGLVSF